MATLALLWLAAPPASGPQLTFDRTVHDFGTIERGADATAVFEFTNTGGADLTLDKVSVGCRCTVPEWSKRPVAPGHRGTITIRYDSTFVGPIERTVTVKSNATDRPIQVIHITGRVRE